MKKRERFLRWFAELDTKTDEAQEDAAQGSSETRYSSEGTYS